MAYLSQKAICAPEYVDIHMMSSCISGDKLSDKRTCGWRRYTSRLCTRLHTVNVCLACALNLVLYAALR